MILALLFGIRAPAAAQGRPLTFSVIGDVPYGKSEAALFQKQMANHNKYSASAFLVHVGDILIGSCAEATYSQVASMMKSLAVPAYIVPGDNETIDCRSPRQGMDLFLQYFQNFEQNFCNPPATVHQKGRPENWAFIASGALFIGVNLVYGGDSVVEPAAAWVQQQLETRTTQVRVAVVLAHFNPNFNTSFSVPFRRAAAAFGKPVLFMHGHGHAWSVRSPFPEKNILRVQVDKGSVEDPVEVTVTMDASSPAKAFLLKRNPWSSLTLVNMPPCVNAGPDQKITTLATTLQGGAKDDGDPGGNLLTTWKKISGPGTVTFAPANALTTTATFGASGTYVLRLLANDSQLQSTDDVKITVQAGGLQPTLAVNDLRINEENIGTTNAAFTVSLSSPKAVTVTVNYQITNGTAMNGSDFVASPGGGILTFPGGTTTQTIAVTILGDLLNEQRDETFFVKLLKATNAIIADSLGVGTIVNDDGAAPPMAPGNLIANATSSSTIALAWKDNASDEAGFQVERKSSGEFALLATVGANVNVYHDSGLLAGTAYVYRVRAFNASGNSLYSNEVSATTLPEGGTGNSNLALNKPVTASSAYVDKPATNAVDGNASTYWRSEAVSSTSPPATLRVDLGAAMTIARVAVSWKENYYAEAFQIQTANDDSNWISAVSTTGASGTQNLNFSAITARYVRLYLTKNQKSNYQVTEFAVYSGAAAKRDQESEVEASEVAKSEAVTDYVLEQNYPNPFSANGIFDNPDTQIHFALPEASNVTITVYTINGAEVRTLVNDRYPAGRHAVIFEAGNLPSGTYFYVMQAGEVRQVRRLMLVK